MNSVGVTEDAEQNPERAGSSQPFAEQNPDARAVRNPARSIFQHSTAVSATKNERRMNGWECQELKNKDKRTVKNVEN